jgi:hypothetical protein
MYMFSQNFNAVKSSKVRVPNRPTGNRVSDVVRGNGMWCSVNCIPETVFRTANGRRKTSGATVVFPLPYAVTNTVTGTRATKKVKIPKILFRSPATVLSDTVDLYRTICM